jgi:hypothetical protein
MHANQTGERRLKLIIIMPRTMQVIAPAIAFSFFFYSYIRKCMKYLDSRCCRRGLIGHAQGDRSCAEVWYIAHGRTQRGRPASELFPPKTDKTEMFRALTWQTHPRTLLPAHTRANTACSLRSSCKHLQALALFRHRVHVVLKALTQQEPGR